MNKRRLQPPAHPPRRAVTAVGYQAPTDYALDAELFPLAELQRRVGDAGTRGLERIDFHCLIYVTAGRYRHMVDFDTEVMTPGSLLLLEPGQVHRFGELSGCEGWMLVFKAELLPARAESAAPAVAGTAVDERGPGRLAVLPRGHVRLSVAAQHAVGEAVDRMADDARRPASAALNALLSSQVQTLLMRLSLDAAGSAADDRIGPVVLRRYDRFRAAVERNFTRWHAVARYADRLGCSEKSLTRAALAVTDRTAKAVISERVVLEAKRLLAHTLLPVATIGDQLGFAEPTNFVKFFRREAGLTPGAFRADQRNPGARRRRA